MLAGLAAARIEARVEACPPAGGEVNVQPFPGTPDASPRSDVAFPGVAPARVRTVTVTGSRSGRHRGRLIALPGGHGAAFLPARPFADAERVCVRARLRSPAPAAPGRSRPSAEVAYSFGVAAPVALSSPALRPQARRASAEVSDGNGFTHTFRSASWLHPPIVAARGRDPDPRQGDVFADAEHSIQSGPLIFNSAGQLIYFQPLQQSAAFNVQVQTYQGQTVLTYWQGYVQNGVGIGRDLILDHHYQPLATVYAGLGYHADLHEFFITPGGPTCPRSAARAMGCCSTRSSRSWTSPPARSCGSGTPMATSP
jgi:hypothetical protein